MAGVVAQFHIVLNEIYSQTVPELTDEWVAENSEDSDTVDEYREEVRETLEENAEETVKSQLQTSIQDALLAQSEIRNIRKEQWTSRSSRQTSIIHPSLVCTEWISLILSPHIFRQQRRFQLKRRDCRTADSTA